MIIVCNIVVKVCRENSCPASSQDDSALHPRTRTALRHSRANVVVEDAARAATATIVARLRLGRGEGCDEHRLQFVNRGCVIHDEHRISSAR